MSEDWRQGGFGLYVHWPFCAAKCPYCDFNSHVARTIDHAAWRNAYAHELERSAAETPGRVLNAIFFGGGTPSLMEPEAVAAVIEAAGRYWTLANDLEVTLEANPGSVEAGRFAAYRDAGVNRVSMGIQALNDRDLARLGRIHSVAEARAAFDIARNCFDRVSFDLIYARQDQTLADWQAELTEALSMAIDHISLYQLTIEQGTAFGDRYNAGKLRGLPHDDLAADMYDATQDICGAHGMSRYEVSNHSRPGSESRHNLIYWHYGDYIGIGPGAHGRLTVGGNRYATEAPRNPQAWLDAVRKASGESERTALSGIEQAQEFLMMGLRLVEGVDPERFAALAGYPLPAKAVSELQDLGMLNVGKTNISVTDQGFNVLNAVLGALLAD
ncbi:radical SAM family heme chaperone HemW [Albibacillus kandeliae]|uniref:radical SAM family heme chaperone HemW n=1 Tax=Albibacillus kandeliae TaxID=2174228 RepID=UPI000D688844|nr:radical SAM family heme chaperone HemW [Albibacillus kandeliae]